MRRSSRQLFGELPKNLPESSGTAARRAFRRLTTTLPESCAGSSYQDSSAAGSRTASGKLFGEPPGSCPRSCPRAFRSAPGQLCGGPPHRCLEALRPALAFAEHSEQRCRELPSSFLESFQEASYPENLRLAGRRASRQLPGCPPASCAASLYTAV